METGKGRSRVRCNACGASSYATGWQGNTPGLPDVYVHSDEWAMPLAVALELKAEKGRPSEAQKELATRRLTVIVRSVKEALAIIQDAENKIGNEAKAKRLAGMIEQL